MSIMMKEIEEQPAALERTLRAERRHAEQFADRLKAREVPLIVLVARGTSDNAAMFGRYLLELTTGIPASLSAPSIHTLYKARLRLRNALVIGVSQSGEGQDINLVLESCRQAGALTVGITNEADSTMARLVDEVFLIRAGKERSVAATKTYTGQLLIFYLLAAALGDRKNRLDIERLPEWAAHAVTLKPSIEAMVERYRFMEHCVVIGRGLNYANAFELALKLMEACYVIAERFSSADFQHGPIAVVERNFPVFLFAPPGRVFPDILAVHERLHQLGAETVVISSEPRIQRRASRAIAMPDRIDDLLSPIPYIIPGQMFAALLAEAKGLSPDQPRSLRKITQTK
jgi:glucosamine--fructose-6-phosphate aminotransferase (isomerizing)